MAIISKVETRINIKAMLERTPTGEELNMLDILIEQHKRHGREGSAFKRFLWCNIIMTALMFFISFSDYLLISIFLAFGAIPMWILFIKMLVTTGKHGNTQTGS